MTDKPDATQLRLPPGLSPAEEADWWDAHRDFWDADDAEWEVLPPQKVRRTEHVNLWLPVDLIEALKEEAENQGVGYQTVAKRWLDERAAAEKKRRTGKMPKTGSDANTARPPN